MNKFKNITAIVSILIIIIAGGYYLCHQSSKPSTALSRMILEGCPTSSLFSTCERTSEFVKITLISHNEGTGLTLDAALSGIKSYQKIDMSFYFFVRNSIIIGYKNPEQMLWHINSGNWTNECCQSFNVSAI